MFFSFRRQREKGKIFDDNDNDDDDDDDEVLAVIVTVVLKNFKTMMNSIVHSIFSI